MICIYDGIAGSGKTTKAIQHMTENGHTYVLLTSTNRLKKAHEARFHVPAYTIAGKCFVTHNGHFYQNPRDIDADGIIMDEVLQTSPAAIQWAVDYGRKHEIYVCCDTAQMLAPNTGAACIDALQRVDADRVTLPETLRPIDSETIDIYQRLYQMARENPEGNKGMDLLNSLPRVNLDSITYSKDSAYMVHTNVIEKRLYQMWRISHRDDLDLIPKGYIASRETAGESYPVLSQLDAVTLKINAYKQVANIGSVVRYQGSEVEPTSEAVFFMYDGDYVTNREIYTMVTRCKSIHSLKLCVLDPVKESRKIVAAPEVDPVSSSDFPGGVHIWNIIKRDPCLAMSEPERLYRCIQDRTGLDSFQTPQNMDLSDVPHDTQYQYGIDLYSSYPHCWHHTVFPDGTTYREDDSGKIKLYVTTSNKIGKKGTLLTGDYVDYMRINDKSLDVVCVGSCDPMTQNKVGEYLYERCTRSQEAKSDLKGMCYGWLQKKYYVKTKDGYYIQPRARYELCIAALQSTQALVLAKLRTLIYGDAAAGRSTVDCLYFNYGGDIIELGEKVRAVIPGYRFRIFQNTSEEKTADKPILYRNYTDLPTEEEYKRNKKKLQKRKERAKK